MKQAFVTATRITSSIVASHFALASPLFIDEFASEDVGAEVDRERWAGGSGFVVVNESVSSVFGVPARFGRISGPNMRHVAEAELPTSGIVTMQFDFSEPGNGGDQPLSFGIGKSGELNDQHACLSFKLSNGRLSAGENTIGPEFLYPVESGHRITVIFNRSSVTDGYEFRGGQFVAGRAADVWLGPVGDPASSTKVGTYFSSSTSSTANQFVLRTWSAGSGNTMYVDNISIHQGPVLPGWRNGDPWRSALYRKSWVPPGPSTADFHADAFIQDFSRAGYRSGTESIPEVDGPELVVTEAPFFADSSGKRDSTAAIQAAIDAAANAGGGVIKFPPGTFRIRPHGSDRHALCIRSSNIVIRGSGVGKTFLFNDSPEMREKFVILVEGPSTASFTHNGPDSVALAEDLSGPATTIPVENAAVFSVGDWVTIRADATDAWCLEHGADGWVGYGSSLRGLAYRRRVIGVDQSAGTIEVDIPTRYALKRRDFGRVVKAGHPGIVNIGLEDFSIGMIQRGGVAWAELDLLHPNNTSWHAHGSFAIYFRRIRDSWVRRVESYQPTTNLSTTTHLLSNGVGLDDSCRVTIADCHFQRPQYGGAGGNGYMYRVANSSDNLLVRCRATFSRHGFVFSSMRSSGNVLHRCIDKDTGKQTGSTGYEDTVGTGSDHHMHFSHSNLIDACTADSSYFTAAFRPWGIPPLHDVTAAHSVFWNTEGLGNGGAVVETEQCRYGYAIGTRGSRTGVIRQTRGGARMSPQDWIEGVGAGETLEPFSIFEDQVARRLSESAPNGLEAWRILVFGDRSTDGAFSGNNSDPDQDGVPNLVEFALATDPLKSSQKRVLTLRIDQEFDGASYPVLTIPVRTGAVFRGGGELTSEPIDGIIYRIQGSSDLTGFPSVPVVEVFPDLSDFLPSLPAGWSYRCFRLAPSASELPAGFFRVAVELVDE